MARNKNIDYDEEEYGDDYLEEDFDEETSFLKSAPDRECKGSLRGGVR